MHTNTDPLFAGEGQLFRKWEDPPRAAGIAKKTYPYHTLILAVPREGDPKLMLACPKLPFDIDNENLQFERLIYVVFNHSFHEFIRTPYLAKINRMFMENATGWEFAKENAMEAVEPLRLLSNSFSPENLAAVLQLLGALSRSDPIRMQADASINTSSIKDLEKLKRADMIVRYMRENYKRAITLKGLADHIGLSREYISKACRECLPGGFAGFLRRLRLEEAARLLRHTDYSILSIAMECGYIAMNNFMEQFKKEYGMTPGRFRRGVLHTPD